MGLYGLMSLNSEGRDKGLHRKNGLRDSGNMGFKRKEHTVGVLGGLVA